MIWKVHQMAGGFLGDPVCDPGEVLPLAEQSMQKHHLGRPIADGG